MRTQDRDLRCQFDDPLWQTLADDYELGHALGFGSFGSVMQARHIHTGKIVAIKLIK